MKALKLAAVLAFGLTAPALADPALGVWKTQVDDGAYAHVTMGKCGANVCGTISRTFNASGEYKSENIGKQIVRSMKPVGGGKYEGKVWRPSNNKIYIGKIDLAGNSLKLAGCIAGGLLCSKQTWTRIK
ncbi:uncharacterized protein (DUF2147 family) [Litoreibacter ponti]|uniref:Uncharacterized protein (DUF2147 family) n=1 Tax=Litoreibacter ponti TaxID=1510457 RepID=A0A2T6BDF6_9RHOB|nr:DUF2147 domain-containing protein [Litoreibacter ponti]PTX54107.1 uncharacterized protein (DUF2147 family) [Litoreibacter ponti]